MFFNLARFFPQQQQLDSLLTNPQCDLETILTADGILQEIKGISANKFADHIINHPEMYQKMIDYVIKFEEELTDQKTQIQYPFFCSEILGSQNQKLIDFLFERPEEGINPEDESIRSGLYDHLISFLEQDVLNVTSAGYFSKVYIAIIKKRGYDVWTTLVNNKSIISNLIKHIDIKHIAEIIEKLIILDTTQTTTEETFMNDRKILLQRIIMYLQNKSYCFDIADNICEILQEITSKSMSCLYYNNSEILPFIEQIKRPDLLLDIALKTQRTAPYQVLINLVELQSKETKKEDDEEVIHNQEKDYSMFENILPELPQNLLNQDYYANIFENTNHKQVQPFGLSKMYLLKFIQSLIQTLDINIIQTLLDANLFNSLFKICIQQENNNQIHCSVDKIIRTIIDLNNSQLLDKIFFPMNEKLIRKCSNESIKEQFKNELLDFIIQNHIPQNKQFGFVGFLTSLSNYLIEKPYLQSYLDYPEWNKFVSINLELINQIEKPFLCGVNPKQRQEEEPLDDADTESIMSILKKFNDNNAKNQQVQRNAEILNYQQEPEQEEDNNKDAEEEQEEQQEQQEQEEIEEQQLEEYQQHRHNHIEQKREQFEINTNEIPKEYSEQIHEDEQEYQYNIFWKIEYNQKEAEAILDDYE